MSHRSRGGGRHAVRRRGGFLPHTPVAPADAGGAPDAAQTAAIPGLDLAPGHMRLRPGLPYSDTLLGRVPGPGERLGEFAVGRDARVIVRSAGACGQVGRIARVLPFRRHQPIGLRLEGWGWGLIWFDVMELELLPELDDTAELAAAGMSVAA